MTNGQNNILGWAYYRYVVLYLALHKTRYMNFILLYCWC